MQKRFVNEIKCLGDEFFFLQFVVKKSAKEVLFVICIDNKCCWRLRAMRLKDSNIFKIKKYAKLLLKF